MISYWLEKIKKKLTYTYILLLAVLDERLTAWLINHLRALITVEKTPFLYTKVLF